MHWFVLALVMVVGTAQSQQSPQAPRIESYQQPHKTPPAQQDSEPQTSMAQPTPFAMQTAMHAEKPQKQTADHGEEGTEFWPPFFGYRLKVTDTLLVVFTALLFAATIFLYSATRDLVRGAEETARQELRAYMFVESAHLITIGNPKNVAAKVHIKNFGKTPAYKVQHECILRLDLIPPDKPLTVGLHGESKPTLAPGAFLYHMVEGIGTLDAAQQAAFNSKRLAFYVFGQILYKDAFGKERFTNYRFIKTGGDAALRYCEEGNETEDDQYTRS